MTDPLRPAPFQFGIRTLLVLTAAVAFFFMFTRLPGAIHLPLVVYAVAVLLFLIASMMHVAVRLFGNSRPAFKRRTESIAKNIVVASSIIGLAALLANWGTIVGVIFMDRR